MILEKRDRYLCDLPGTLPFQILRVGVGSVEFDSSFSALLFSYLTSRIGVSFNPLTDWSFIEMQI